MFGMMRAHLGRMARLQLQEVADNSQHEAENRERWEKNVWWVVSDILTKSRNKARPVEGGAGATGVVEKRRTRSSSHTQSHSLVIGPRREVSLALDCRLRLKLSGKRRTRGAGFGSYGPESSRCMRDFCWSVVCREVRQPVTASSVV